MTTEELIGSLRSRIATELAQRSSASRVDTGLGLAKDDQAVLARRLLNEELDKEATARIARGEKPLTEAEEQRLAEAVFQRIFELGRCNHFSTTSGSAISTLSDMIACLSSTQTAHEKWVRRLHRATPS